MRIKITADSTCDLSEELLAQWDIALMPMHILMGEDSYLDGVTIHPADVFAYVNAGGKMPKSAAANLVEYTDFFEPFAKECDAVIHISVSSKLSSCFQNAKLAAGEFENVYVVDSQNICTGQGYLVLKAAKWAADGLTPRNITMRLQSQTGRAELCTGPAGFYGQERPLLRCAGLRGKPAGHQARTGSDRRRTEGSQKIPRQPAHLRGQVHHRPSGRPG